MILKQSKNIIFLFLFSIIVKRNIKQRNSVLPQPISNTTISSIHEDGKCIKFELVFALGFSFLESFYTIYILTEDFQSDMNKPSIFIDLITDETISTNYMRMNTDLAIREHLDNNVLGKFKAHGTRIEKV